MLISGASAVYAGGPITVTRTGITGTPYEATLNCSCSTGSYEVTFKNGDSIDLTVIGKGWQVGPISAGAVATYTVTRPGPYSFSLQEAPSQTGLITIINQPPQFATGATLQVTSVTSTAVQLTWPVAQDDGGAVSYKLYQDDHLLTETTQNSWAVSALKSGISYSFLVEAYDSAGVRAGQVLATHVTTQIAPATPKSTSSPTPVSTVSSAPYTLATFTPVSTAPVDIPKSTSTPSGTSSGSTSLPTISSESPSSTPSLTSSDLSVALGTITVNGEVKNIENSPTVSRNTLTVRGKAQPNAKVIITLHSQPQTFETSADAAGDWQYDIPLASLEQGAHTIFAQYELHGVRGPEQKIFAFNYRKPLNFLVAMSAGISGTLLIGLAVFFALRTTRQQLRSVPVVQESEEGVSSEEVVWSRE